MAAWVGAGLAGAAGPRAPAGPPWGPGPGPAPGGGGAGAAPCPRTIADRPATNTNTAGALAMPDLCISTPLQSCHLWRYHTCNDNRSSRSWNRPTTDHTRDDWLRFLRR